VNKIAKEYRLPEALRGTILEKIMDAKIPEIAASRRVISADDIETALVDAPPIRSFKGALTQMSRNVPAVIAEIKRASPSAGLIREDFSPLKIAESYQSAGAAALSILTEVRYFQGGLDILTAVRERTPLPVLRKDFIVDPYQIIEARRAGADAVLLIAALLDAASLKMLREEAERLGMDALVEVHSEDELGRALDAGAGLIGVNNRDLRAFTVDLNIALNLVRLMPNDITAVAESGIKTAEDLRRLYDAGYRGFLVGERLMRASDPGAALAELLR